MKTAIEVLIEHIFAGHDSQWKQEIEEAIKLEKEQLLDAYRKGFSEGVCFGVSPTGYNHISADEYFNKTF